MSSADRFEMSANLIYDAFRTGSLSYSPIGEMGRSSVSIVSERDDEGFAAQVTNALNSIGSSITLRNLANQTTIRALQILATTDPDRGSGGYVFGKLAKVVISESDLKRSYAVAGKKGAYERFTLQHIGVHELTHVLAARLGTALPDGAEHNKITNKILKELGIAPRSFDYDDVKCFPAFTEITLSPGISKRISDIRIGDTVLSFDPDATFGRGALVPRRVTRIFHNVTTEWLRLTWTEGLEAKKLVCTPGHHFLDRFGKFPQIEDMLDAGRATVVLASGDLAEVTAERIVYSAETAHLFEQATVAGISAGGAALKPVAVEGWQTYNFEVEELHTYVAGGIRVHNISAPWAHEEWKAEQTTQRLLNIGSVPADYAKKLGDATRGVDEDKRSGNLVGFTSAGRAIALNREVYTSFIAEHGGKYATGSTHAEGAARAAISNGASRKQALALAYKEAENRGVNTMNAGFSARIDRAASIPQTVSSGSSGKSGGGEQKAQPAPKSSGRGSSGKPVLLDLDGNGLKVDTLDVSSTFVDLEGDGYQHRTAWAGAGDGVLVLDADHNGVISRKNEFVFTEWDSTAGTDFDALRQVFDTNRNGKLDAGDARWADFKVMVGGRMVTLAALGIQSIDLIATGSGQTFADGSAIEGTSVFTRTDGTTGTAGDAKLAIDETGYVLGRTAVTHADGSVTRDIKGHGTDGSLAFRNLVTVSADGTTTTTQFDDDGNGVNDRSQIIQRTVNGDGSMLETVSNVRTDGSLRDKVTTATSADHKAITTSADQDGDAIADQIQTFTANADGSTATRVKAVAVNGALLKEVLTTSSADGLTKTIRTDSAGRGIYEKTRTETTVVNGDGSRTETVTERRADNALLSRTLTTTNATNTQRVIDTDHTGNGQYDLKETETTTIAGNGDIVATSEARNRDATLRGRTVTTTTADGLSTTVQSDLTGDAVFDRVTASVTVVEANGTRTTTETSKSGNGALLSKTVDSTSGDGKTILDFAVAWPIRPRCRTRKEPRARSAASSATMGLRLLARRSLSSGL